MSVTVISRRIAATPARSASEAWALIVNLLAPAADSPARGELEAIAGVASCLIAEEAMKDAACAVYGSGPRVRLYCLYAQDAITGENANEAALTFTPTEGSWRMSLPCPSDDLAWVQATLSKQSTHVVARDMTVGVDDEPTEAASSGKTATVNVEVFLKS